MARNEEVLWRTRVGFGEIRAPRSATVTRRYKDVGEAVDERETVFELSAMDALIVPLGVSELDVAHLQFEQTVPLRLDALPGETIEGHIRRIEPSAETDSRLVRVEVALPEEAHELGVRPGYLARVRMPIDERVDVLAVPTAAIGERGDERYVYVIRDDELHRRPWKSVKRAVTGLKFVTVSRLARWCWPLIPLTCRTVRRYASSAIGAEP